MQKNAIRRVRRFTDWPRPHLDSNCLPCRIRDQSLHPLNSLPGPSRPEMPKKSQKCLPKPPATGPQKSPKSLGDSLGSVWRVCGKRLESVSGLSRTFWRLVQGPGQEAPGDIFETFFRIFGPGGPERTL